MQQLKETILIIKIGRQPLSGVKIMKNVTLSPYQVLWLEFIPVKGIVTKHDQKLLGSPRIVGKSPKTFRKPVGTREAGLAFIESLGCKQLDKHYTCRFFTDKQFGMAKESEGYAIHYTQKQIAESIEI